MKKLKTCLLIIAFFAIANCLIIESAHAQDWGIGLRLGDPSGISIKKYTASDRALELNIGRTHILGRRGWYDNRFNDWYKDKKYNYYELEYLGYDASSPIGLQLHYLIQKNIDQIGDANTSGLHWYYGFGAQVRFQSYRYYYRYKHAGSNDWIREEGETEIDIDLGLDGVIGLEYTFSEVPVSVFTDLNLFMEVVDNPFNFYLQGGIGVRYNF